MKDLKEKIVKLKANKPLFITLIVVGVLVIVGISYDIVKGGGIGLNTGVKIVKDSASEVVLEDYNNGNFSIKKPAGWKVDTIGDYIHYTIKMYNPENPAYQFFFNLKTEGYNKSDEAKEWQQKFYPDSIFAKNPVIATKDTEGFYKIFNELGPLNNTTLFTFPTLTDFTVIDNLGNGPFGGDVLRASFKDENGKDAEGLFTACVYDAGPY